MSMNVIRLVVLSTLFCFASSASSKELIKEFKGSGDKTTAEFEVRAPWVLDWVVSSEFEKSMGLQVDLIDASNGHYLGKVVTTKWISDGARLFNESGRFRFEVTASFANWTLRVEKLSRQEAEAYKPR
jgi:hypothetical protein